MDFRIASVGFGVGWLVTFVLGGCFHLLISGEQGICNTVKRLLNIGAYVHFVQDNLVQAQYW